jgi:hypothetical protein
MYTYVKLKAMVHVFKCLMLYTNMSISNNRVAWTRNWFCAQLVMYSRAECMTELLRGMFCIQQ